MSLNLGPTVLICIIASCILCVILLCFSLHQCKYYIVFIPSKRQKGGCINPDSPDNWCFREIQITNLRYGTPDNSDSQDKSQDSPDKSPNSPDKSPDYLDIYPEYLDFYRDYPGFYPDYPSYPESHIRAWLSGYLENIKYPDYPDYPGLCIPPNVSRTFLKTTNLS